MQTNCVWSRWYRTLNRAISYADYSIDYEWYKSKENCEIDNLDNNIKTYMLLIINNEFVYIDASELNNIF